LNQKKEDEIKLKEEYLRSFKLDLKKKQAKIKLLTKQIQQLGKDRQYIIAKRLIKLGKNENSDKIKRMEILENQKAEDQAQIQRLTQQIKKLKPKQKRYYRVISHSTRGTNVRFENESQDTFLSHQQFQQLDPDLHLLE